MQIPVEVFIGTIGTIVTTVIGAGIRKVWVWGWNLVDQAAQYERLISDRDAAIKDIRADRDHWQSIALRQAGILETTVKVVEQKANGG